MNLEQLKTHKKFNEILDEDRAREWAWSLKGLDHPVQCPHCGGREFYVHDSRPEVRTCEKCLHQTRLRTGTLFENSHVPLSIWFKAIYWITHRERPMSILELKARLGLHSYGTVWALHKKIQNALGNPETAEIFQKIFDSALAGSDQSRGLNERPKTDTLTVASFRSRPGTPSHA